MGDAEVEATVEVDVGVGAPELFAEFVAEDNFVGAGEEDGQQLGRLGLEAHGGAVAAKFAGGGLEVEGPEADAPVV